MVGSRPDRCDRHHHRLRLRSGLRRQGTRRRLRRDLRPGLRRRRAGRAPVRNFHRRHPAAADPVRRGPRRLLPVPRREVHRAQGHPDQLRLPADRAFPADAVHLGRRAADRDGPLVLRGRPARRAANADADADRCGTGPDRRTGGQVRRGVPTATPPLSTPPSRKPKRKHSIDRPATAEKRTRSGRPAQRSAPTRSRHARPPLDDITDAAAERPRRQTTRRRPPEFDPADEVPRRRPRPPRDRRPHARRPRRREPREPRERRDPYAPPPRRERPPRAVPALRALPAVRPLRPYPPYEPPPARRRPPPADSTPITRCPGCGIAGQTTEPDAAQSRVGRGLDAVLGSSAR